MDSSYINTKNTVPRRRPARRVVPCLSALMLSDAIKRFAHAINRNKKARYAVFYIDGEVLILDVSKKYFQKRMESNPDDLVGFYNWQADLGSLMDDIKCFAKERYE